MDSNAQIVFEEIVGLNSSSRKFDLTKIDSAISTFNTYVNPETELLWRFFHMGWHSK